MLPANPVRMLGSGAKQRGRHDHSSADRHRLGHDLVPRPSHRCGRPRDRQPRRRRRHPQRAGRRFRGRAGARDRWLAGGGAGPAGDRIGHDHLAPGLARGAVLRLSCRQCCDRCGPGAASGPARPAHGARALAGGRRRRARRDPRRGDADPGRARRPARPPPAGAARHPQQVGAGGGRRDHLVRDLHDRRGVRRAEGAQHPGPADAGRRATTTRHSRGDCNTRGAARAAC